MVHHSVPDDKKAGKAKDNIASKTDPSVNLLLPARPSNSEKVYKASHSHDDTSSSDKIVAKLEQMVRQDVAAVNERNWSHDSPLWQSKASYWEAELPATSGFIGKLTLKQFNDALQKIVAARPDYLVSIIDLNTNVDERNGRAEVYCNVETHGFFPGVTQTNVTLYEYHCLEGKWYHVAHRTMYGIDSQRMPTLG